MTNNALLERAGPSPWSPSSEHRCWCKGPTGERAIEHWDATWRRNLTIQAEKLVRQLWKIGIREVYLDGSFLEDKPHPNDIDGYFVCDVFDFSTGEIQRRLNAIDPHKIWTWDPASRKPYRGYAKKQLPMWHSYRVELYPHYGQFSGIHDDHGNDLLFPAAFRRKRSTNAGKGILKIIHGEEPLL